MRMNRASDGIVYSSPEVVTSTGYTPGQRRAAQPSGSAMTSPSRSGSAASTAWVPARLRTSLQCSSAHVMTSRPAAPDRRRRPA